MTDKTVDFSRELVKHEDQRGTLFEVYRRDLDDIEVRQVYFSTSKKGAVRGNHYHRRKTECFCVIAGKARLHLKDLQSGQECVLELKSQSPRFIKIPPFVAHAIVASSDGTMELLVFTTEEFNPDDPDVYESLVVVSGK